MNEIIENHITNHTLLGVGTMSTLCIEAAMEVVKKYRYPIIFICSRNQIESHVLGSGYVNGWSSRELKNYIQNRAKELCIQKYIFIGRDHGGPWQNDREYKKNVSESTAFSNCLLSYYEDLDAGFDFIHIDTSRDPNLIKVPIEIAINRAIYILRNLENYRISNGYAEVVYEISVDETRCSEASLDEYKTFCERFIEETKAGMLPMPKFVVGNTGTYTKMDTNIGSVDYDVVRALYKVSQLQGVLLKEHNADYLDQDTLRQHFEIGIRMVNVAPEFAHKETCKLLEMERLWNQYVDNELMDSTLRTNIEDILINNIILSDKWKKWIISYDGSDNKIFDDKQLRNKIVVVNGHYFYHNIDVMNERRKLMTYLEKYKLVLRPENNIIKQIKLSIERYLKAFS